MSATSNARPRLLILTTAAALLVGAIASSAAVAISARPPAQPTAVAVIDLPAVIEGLDERNRLNTQLEQMKSQSEASLKELIDRIEKLRADVQGPTATYKPNTPDWTKAMGQLMELSAQAEGRRNYLNQAASLNQGGMLRDLFLKVENAIQRIAEREGYDIVLLNDSTFPLPERAPDNQMQAQILSKSVLYAHSGADITQQVIDLLNSEFRAP